MFARPLGPHSADLAVVLFNRAEQATNLSATWEELGVPTGVEYAVRDVVNRRDLRRGMHKLEMEVARHDVAFVVLREIQSNS